ncbi:metal-dependent hydrolase [Sphingomonas histidinilytica]|uniref:Endonuclease/Exonuclease/phosphatase family protein n=1 Tax=Rhizorhabdus histidinilytica TaxID=439228 RepID=A0A1T5AT27_9SPHN|nr:endonuclease/exonuclease/phosphatase family protein [Rhizorhabdus histidinilytica]MBO9376927.1 metal-dependent hydrolase [Rhizorhabdus histidinilytica]SKB37997.1 Endonuclease/Exonuclease/phosphatase family protein [Rhizorhabdus histidinilytica]
MTSWLGRLSGLLLLPALAGCAPPPPIRVLPAAKAPAPAIVAAETPGEMRTTLSVLTYNIEGLGWPARKGRKTQLREIGRRLAELRERGEAPDVAMFQEMFSGRAKRAVAASGYPAIVAGPQRLTFAGRATDEPLPGKSRFRRGELGLKLLGSGLAIASRYPLDGIELHPYGLRSCAGIDCLANKGIVRALLHMPGVPVPVELYDTHMNSQGASRAPKPRALAAHMRQSREASGFIAGVNEPAYPLIFGGDFNMRWSEERFADFSRYVPLEIVHRWCVAPDHGCDVRMSWDGDEPWMDTQDLQLFRSSPMVAIRPIRVEAMFDGGALPRLSDHDGFLVTYELRWRADGGTVRDRR